MLIVSSCIYVQEYRRTQQSLGPPIKSIRPPRSYWRRWCRITGIKVIRGFRSLTRPRTHGAQQSALLECFRHPSTLTRPYAPRPPVCTRSYTHHTHTHTHTHIHSFIYTYTHPQTTFSTGILNLIPSPSPRPCAHSSQHTGSGGWAIG